MNFKTLREWSKGLKWQGPETLEALHVRHTALEAREAKATERETTLLVMEQDAKAHQDQVDKDAHLLRQQLQGARAEVEDQRRYVEEKRNKTEAMATIIEAREARLKLKEQELAERKVSDLEIGHCARGITINIMIIMLLNVLLNKNTSLECRTYNFLALKIR